MKAKEFVNKNIKFGDKVRITLMTGKTVDCFFGGYKTYGNVEPSLDYLLPTFYAIGKSGDMAKRSPFGPTTCPRVPFSSIKDIENLTEIGTPYHHMFDGCQKVTFPEKPLTEKTAEELRDELTKRFEWDLTQMCLNYHCEYHQMAQALVQGGSVFIAEPEEEEQTKEGEENKDLKKFEVTLYYHTNVTVEVEAEDEESARDAAYAEVSDEKYTQEILEGLQEDSDPDVVEITD